MINVWGDVDGNPRRDPAGRDRRPARARSNLPAGGHADVPQLLDGAARSAPRAHQANPAVGQYIGYLDWITDAGWQQYHGLLLSLQRRSASGLTTSANYTLSTLRGPDQPGAGAAQRRHRLHAAGLADQSAVRRRTQAIFDADKGPCSNWRTHIFNLTRERRDAAVQQHGGAMLASGWRLSGIFRAQSGDPLTITTGADRALTGMQATTQRAEPGAGRSVRRQDAATTGSIRRRSRSRRSAPTETRAATPTRARARGRRPVARAVVPVRQHAPDRGAHRGVQRVQLVPAGATRTRHFSSATFGRIRSSGDPRIMQFAVKYQF